MRVAKKVLRCRYGPGEHCRHREGTLLVATARDLRLTYRYKDQLRAGRYGRWDFVDWRPYGGTR